MTTMSTSKQILGLFGWLMLCFAASALGALASLQAQAFYGLLIQPAWAPPPWLFGPVWAALYTLMALAAWLVWRIEGFRANRTALLLFLTQLAANALWSWLFFSWKQGGLAFAEIILLWVLIVATMLAFWRVSQLAAGLLLPYLLWVSFAALLNYSLWQLNPQIL